MPTTTIGINTTYSGTGTAAADVALGKVGATATKAERDLLAYANAVARTQRQSGDAAGAIKTYQSALSQVNGTSKQAISTAGQLASAIKTVERSTAGLQVLPRSLESFGAEALGQIKTGLLSIVGPAALVTAGFHALGGSVEAAQKGLALRENQNALRAVSGSALVYADALAVARKQQVLFGGSLQENIEGLQGLVITSRDTGASLKSLVDLAARLNIKSPEQGISGARIALQEAFSEGNITSLARRFEIPRAALAAFKDENVSTAEKVQILSKYLDGIGISSEVVAGRADATALAYRGLNAELERASLNAGGQLADAFAQQATGLARLVGVVNGNPEAIAQILALRRLGGSGGVGPADIERQARNLRVADASDAETGARDAAFARDKLGGVTVNTKALDEAHNRLIVLSASSDAARDKVIALYQAFAHTGDIQAFTNGVRQLEEAQTRGTKATYDSKQAISDELAEKVKSQVETGQLAFLQSQLEKDSQLAAIGMLGAGNQAELLAKKYNLAAGEAAFLIRQQQQIGLAAGLADQRLGERSPGASGTAERRAADEADQIRIFNRLAKPAKDKAAQDAKAAADKARQESERLADLQFQNQLIKAKDHAAKIKLLQGQLAKTTDPVERQQLQNQIDQEQIAAQKAQISGANSLASAADKRLRTEESIYDAIQKQRDAMLDIEELTIKDRQQDREDAAKVRTAQKITQATEGRTDARALDLRGRAQDVIALADVENRKRAFELEQKQATVGGTITDKGRLLQSVQGGGAVPSPSGAAAPISAPQAASPSAGAGAMLNVNVIIDGNTAWTGMAPYAWEDFMRGVRQVAVGQGAQ